MNYDILLFDFDGVMIKNPFLFSDELHREFGLRVDRMLPFFTGVFKECGVGRADLKQELAKVIGDWGWKGTEDELIAYWLTKGTRVDEGMVAFVQQLRAAGCRCFMTTDQEKYRGEHLRAWLGGGKVFEEVFYSAMVGCTKKDDGFFEYVWRSITSDAQHPLNKERVLFIDDAVHNVEKAKVFGFDGYVFGSREELKKKIYG